MSPLASITGGETGQVELLRRLEDRLRRPSSDSALVLIPPDAEALHAGPIVCAVDATSPTRRAVALARSLAEDLEAPLVLVHTRSFRDAWSDLGQRDVAVRARLSALHETAANVRRVIGRHPIATLTGETSPQSLLADFAREHDARLLIVAPPASAAGWVPADLAGQAACPVVLLSVARAR